MEPAIHLAPGAEHNGFASMLATLIRQNVDDRPEKKASLLKMEGRVTLVVQDLGIDVTLVFARGHVHVHDGRVGIPDVTITADSEWHTQMSLIELHGSGLPDPRGEVTRAIFQAGRDGAIHTKASLAGVSLALRLTKVLSVG